MNEVREPRNAAALCPRGLGSLEHDAEKWTLVFG
jgi:hypothetical protein